MTIRHRLAALEARASTGGVSLAVRAWLGHHLSPAESKQAAIEAAEPDEIDWSSMSKEAQEWLQA